MKKLLEYIKLLATEEYWRAAEKFGECNNSSHESYAVIKEEFDEALWALGEAESNLNDFWEAVKRNDTNGQKMALESLEMNAMYTASEVVQVGAMAQKALRTTERGFD